MCVTSIQTSPDCQCKIDRYFVCNKHIRHTARQKDNDECPDLEVRNIETLDSDCLRDPMTACKKEQHYTFESYPNQMRKEHENKFQERCTDDFADCFDGKMRYGFQHGCGIGLAMHRQKKWRHVADLASDDSMVENKEVYVKEVDRKEDDPFADSAAITEMDGLEFHNKGNMITNVEDMEK